MQAPADAIILASALDWHNRRPMLQWLLLSLLLHALVAWWLQGRLVLPRYEAPAATAPIELTLRRPAPAAAPAPVLPADPPAVEPAQPEEVPAVTAPQTPSPALPDESVPLDLSLPEFIEPGAKATTDNGATVMNAELLQRLQRAPRRTGVEAQVERQASGDFQGGSWVEFVRTGDACFQVARANSLLSFDYDVWYRVACPD